MTDDFLGLSALRYKGISIGIGDIDNDGKDDLLMGHLNGTIDYVKNLAASAAATPFWGATPVPMKDAAAKTISTNGFAVPLVYDIDADGVKDLLIGDQMGYLFYYKNYSTCLLYTSRCV